MPSKILDFLFKKPKVVVLAKDGETEIKRLILQILGPSFKVEREVLFVDSMEKTNLTAKEHLILNFDNSKDLRVGENDSLKILTFGFKEGADLLATDLKQNGATNFKVNYKGNIVPMWLQKSATQEEIYLVLAAVAIGTIFKLNLVEISQALKES